MSQGKPLRVIVIGISGSGKTTFATHLSAHLGIKQIELDLLNWRPGWYDRYRNEFDAFKSDLLMEISAESWVVAGGYTKVRHLVFERATCVVWLDLPKHLILWRVFTRSVKRATDRRPILNGNYEGFERWLDKGHPIRIVWGHYQRKKRAFAEQLQSDAARHLKVYRCRSRDQVDEVLHELVKFKKRDA